MEASLQYCGHSTVIVTAEDGTRVIIDPWLKGNPSCPESLYNPGKIDAIVLTHGHSDHTGSAVEVSKKSKAPVFGTFELVTLLAKDGAQDPQGMNKGGSMLGPGGIKISLTNAFHSSSYDAADGQTYYAGEACGIVLTLPSGLTIYHAGDTQLFSDMTLIREEFDPDVVLLPIGDRFTMGPRAAAKAAAWLNAEIIIPIHYGTFPLLTGTAEDFGKELQRYEMRPTVLEPGAVFPLKKK